MPSQFQLREAARCLHAGGILAYPTEAVWGLGCDPLNEQAVHRLLALKQRPVNKGLIIIAADFRQLQPFVRLLDDAAMQPVLDSWPGPFTWILPAATGTPRWLTGDHDSLAVRITDHPAASALCRAFGGPIVSTSANIAGQRPARSALQAKLRCGRIDGILHGAVGGLTRPTGIRDARSGRQLRN